MISRRFWWPTLQWVKVCSTLRRAISLNAFCSRNFGSGISGRRIRVHADHDKDFDGESDPRRSEERRSLHQILLVEPNQFQQGFVPRRRVLSSPKVNLLQIFWPSSPCLTVNIVGKHFTLPGSRICFCSASPTRIAHVFRATKRSWYVSETKKRLFENSSQNE